MSKQWQFICQLQLAIYYRQMYKIIVSFDKFRVVNKLGGCADAVLCLKGYEESAFINHLKVFKERFDLIGHNCQSSLCPRASVVFGRLDLYVNCHILQKSAYHFAMHEFQFWLWFLLLRIK
jgi:hypothetical protein